MSALIEQAIAILPDVAGGYQWIVTTEKHPKGGKTACFELLDPTGQPCGRGRIAVDLYGITAIRERGIDIARKAGAI